MDCSCVYTGIDANGMASMLVEKYLSARVPHKCHECDAVIQKGEAYYKEVSVYDGVVATHKTCVDCMSLRDAFFCDGWFWGDIWTFMAEHVHYSDGRIKESCVAALTPVARDKVCQLIERRWSDLE